MKKRKRNENLKIGWRHRLVFSLSLKKQFLVIVVKMQKQIAKFSGLAKFCWFSYILQNILSLIVGICTIFSYFVMTVSSRLWTIQKLFAFLSCTLPKHVCLCRLTDFAFLFLCIISLCCITWNWRKLMFFTLLSHANWESVKL